MPTRAELSRRRPAQRMRKPLRFRAVRDLSRPTPTRTAPKPESSGEDEISDSANSVAQKSAKAGRCGKRTDCAAIGTEIAWWRSSNCSEVDEVERAEGPRFLSVSPVPDSFRRPASLVGFTQFGCEGDWRPSAISWGFGSQRTAGGALFGHCLYGYTQPFGMSARGHFALRQSSWFLDVEMRINPQQPPLSAASRDTRSGRRAWRRPSVRRRSSSCRAPSREDW
jgi:hypothetical protein